MPLMRFEIPGQPDFELQSDRDHPVTILAETPESGDADGLVFIIQGMGGDKDENYSTMLRRYLADKYNLIAVSVDGHCNTCRAQRSTEFGTVGVELEPSSTISALGQYVAHGGRIDAPLRNHEDILNLLRKASPQPYLLHATLVPPGGQYQNFGVLTALDHIAALHFLIDQGLKFDTSNVVCLGSSHGGYIAHMMNKFAPNTFNGIIDASAYTETATMFIDGDWREMTINDGNLVWKCSTVQRWQFKDPGEKTFFGPDRSLIRDTACSAHVSEIVRKSHRPCQFRMIHSESDGVSSPNLKVRQAGLLKSNGFDASLDLITEKDIDGKFIKSGDHGMGVALNLLFDRYYPSLHRREGQIDRNLETDLTFNGPRMSYRLGYRRGKIHADASCTEVDLASDTVGSAAKLAS